MKLKLYALTALSLAGLAMSATPASAWFLCRNHGCNRFSTVIVCRPYNAFTPVCSGSLVCDGCCPFSCPQLPSGASCSPMLGNPMLGMAHNPSAINSPYAMQMMQTPPSFLNGPYALPGMQPAPIGALPAPQQFQGPVPTSNQQPQPMLPQQLQPAAYNQAYYPAYYPTYQRPMNPYQQVPSYWYGY